jgi:hypothetical protein
VIPQFANKKIFIATPMYGGQCYGQYTWGLIQNILSMKANGVEFMFQFIANESLITRARNDLAYQFMQSDATHLMFIDSDIEFQADGILKLLAADEDIVCGIYPKKKVDWDNVKRAAKDGKEDLENFAGSFVFNLPMGQTSAQTDERGLIEIRHGGTGFMLIKREVFEKLAPHVKSYRVSTERNQAGEFIAPPVKEYFALEIEEDNNNFYASEDYFFCNLWRRHGGKVYAQVNAPLNHVGTYVYNGRIVNNLYGLHG